MSVGVENLDPGVLPIANINAVVLFNHHGMRKHEFAGAGSVGTPALDEITVAIELYDARIPVAVRHKDGAVLGECDISRFSPLRSGPTRSRRPKSPRDFVEPG